MNKLPLSYVAKEVDKLYEKQFDKDDVEGINKHCDFIRTFINSCGYTEEEFDDYIAGYDTTPILVLN